MKYECKCLMLVIAYDAMSLFANVMSEAL